MSLLGQAAQLGLETQQQRAMPDLAGGVVVDGVYDW